MDKEFLINKAKDLKQPSNKAAEEFASKRDILANKVTIAMKARTDLYKLIGKDNLPMMEDNHRNKAKFMESVFYLHNPEVLVDTVLWVFRAYRSHGFELTYWPAQLDTWVRTLKEELTPTSFSEIYPFYNFLITNQASFVSLSDVHLTKAHSH